MSDKLWLKLPEVFKTYQTTYSELIKEITFGKIKANIVGGVVFFNSDELKIVFKPKNNLKKR